MSRMRKMLSQVVLAAALLISAIMIAPAANAQTVSPPAHVIAEFGEPPAVPDGAISAELRDALRAVFVDSLAQSAWGPDQEAALLKIAESGDPRLAWVIADMMRFTWASAKAMWGCQVALGQHGSKMYVFSALCWMWSRSCEIVSEMNGGLAHQMNLCGSGWKKKFPIECTLSR